MPEILRMPEVAAGASEAVLSTWNVAVGATFVAGEAIVTVETDKAVVDVEAETGGVMLRQLVDDGSHVEVGSPIAVYRRSWRVRRGRRRFPRGDRVRDRGRRDDRGAGCDNPVRRAEDVALGGRGARLRQSAGTYARP